MTVRNSFFSSLASSQLRRAYDAQGEEIRKLKQQVVLKDRRIRELEDQLQRYKLSYLGDSTAWCIQAHSENGFPYKDIRTSKSNAGPR